MLFKKAAVFGDLHFGKKSNSRTFNQDCADYIDWFIETAHAEQVDAVIFVGDWHDNRRFINIATLHFSLVNLRKLNAAFDRVFMIMGNHDLYYKENRDIHSMIVGETLENIQIINEVTTIDNVTFIPWLVEDEWKNVVDVGSKYVFGHLELPTFKMNAMTEMADNGRLNKDHLMKPDYVFSGHFHKRQNKGNVWYIGNAFPHDYADTWDDDRGLMLLEWGKEPTFRSWSRQPRYRTLRLSQLLDEPSRYLDERTYARVTVDADLTYEEMVFLKETFAIQYNCREIVYSGVQSETETNEYDIDSDFLTVDQIVIEGINAMSDSATIDNTVLLDIYTSLEEGEN